MIAILGAGLAGLTAARELDAEGVKDFVVIEAKDQVGGRVQSQVKEGFILDAGFQVLNPAYDILREYIDTDELELGFFDSGALLLQKNASHQEFFDPTKHPQRLLQSVFSSPFSIPDLLSLAALKLKSLGTRVPEGESEITSKLEYELVDSGISEEVIKRFLRPFFAGVLLSEDLQSTSQYFHYLFNLFGKSRVGLPKDGMVSLAKAIASPLADSRFLLGTKVDSINEGRLHLASGKSLDFDKIILATDFKTSYQLLNRDAQLDQGWRGVYTHYFSAKAPPWSENLLGLIPWDDNTKLNHIAILSSAQPSYAPPGEVLLSVNQLAEQGEPLRPEEIIKKLAAYSFEALEGWEHLHTASISGALPSCYHQGSLQDPSDSVFLAGDFTETPSIAGAMLSGKKAAKRLLRTFR